MPDGYCLLYQFQLLNWGLFGNCSAWGQLFGDNCFVFVFVFGLVWFGFGWVVWLQPKKLVQILEAKKRLAMEAQVRSSTSSRTATHQQKKQQHQQKKKKKKTSFCCAFCRVLGCVEMSIGVKGNNAAGHPTLLVFVAAAHCLRFLSVLQIFRECSFLLLFSQSLQNLVHFGVT